MLFIFPAPVLGVLALNPVPSGQSRVQADSSQVTVQIVVTREPRVKQPEQAGEKTPGPPTTPAVPQAPTAPLVSRTFTGAIQLRLPDAALITVNDEKRIERQRLTINIQTAVLWQAATKPGQPSLYKERQFAGAADSQVSGGKDRLTFLLSKTALLDPVSAYILAGDNPRPALEREGVTTWTTRPDSTMQECLDRNYPASSDKLGAR
jgi:hypothetical protein